MENHEVYGEGKVGQDKASKEVVEEHDKTHGIYKDAVEEVSVDDRLPTANMPKAPDPSPFVLGSMTPTSR